jgi:ketosteroid isomerase-like protein
MGYEEHQAGGKGLHMNFAFVADVGHRHVRPNGEFEAFLWTSDATRLACPENVRELVAMAVHGASSPLVATARAWLAAFNRRDLDALLSLYADDAVHTSPKLRAKNPESHGAVHGKAALRAWWADAMERLPELHYAERHLTASGERVLMEYLRENPGEAPLEVAEVLVVRGGRIVGSHVYHG